MMVMYINPQHEYVMYINPWHEYVMYINPWHEYVMYINPQHEYVMYINPRHEYVMYSGGPPIMLDTTTNEKDLGVHVDANLTFEHHVEDVVNKGNRMLGMIRRSNTYLDGPTMTNLYTSLIRPLLEYSIVAWTPVLKRG